MQNINYTDQGSGFPVVFLHGFCENHSLWDDYALQLSKNYRIICPDLPGFGKSQLPTLLSLASVAKDLHKCIEGLGIAHYAVIGHSLGGYIALELVHQFKNQIEGLGLFNSNAFPDNEEDRHKRDKAILFLQKHAVEKFIQPFTPSLFHPNNQQRLQVDIQKAIAIGCESKIETIRAYTLAMKNRQNHFSTWANFDKPALFIGGDEDS